MNKIFNRVVKCKTCGRQISRGAICPRCGRDNWSLLDKYKFFMLAVLLVFFSIYGLINSINSYMNREVTNEESSYKIDKKEVKVEIVGSHSNGFSLYIGGTLVNTSGKDLTYIQILIPTYNENGSRVGSAIATINNLKDGETWEFEAVDLSNGTKFDPNNYDIDAF